MKKNIIFLLIFLTSQMNLAEPLENHKTTNQISLEEVEENKSGVILTSVRYLGPITQGGPEIRVYNQFSLGLNLGQFSGQKAGSDKRGFIQDLKHYSVTFNAYLGKTKDAFDSGLYFRFGFNYNIMGKDNSIKEVIVDDKSFIRPGEERYGAQLGIGYGYRFGSLYTSIGAEYFRVGVLKNLVPLSFTVGLVF